MHTETKITDTVVKTENRVVHDTLVTTQFRQLHDTIQNPCSDTLPHYTKTSEGLSVMLQRAPSGKIAVTASADGQSLLIPKVNEQITSTEKKSEIQHTDQKITMSPPWWETFFSNVKWWGAGAALGFLAGLFLRFKIKNPLPGLKM